MNSISRGPRWHARKSSRFRRTSKLTNISDPAFGALLVFLERIAVDGNCVAVQIDRVNPLYFNKIDQIHVVGGSPVTIPTDHDLV